MQELFFCPTLRTLDHNSIGQGFWDKTYKREGWNSNSTSQFDILELLNQQEIFLVVQQFTTTPTFPNPYITCTLNNMELVKMINNKRKDWIKKYHKIIWEIERIVDIQLQL